MLAFGRAFRLNVPAEFPEAPVARKQRSKSRGPGGPQAPGAPAQQRPQGAGGGGGGGGSGWGPLRDSVRRDVEQAISSLAFAERLHQKLDTQRRVFLDFPRAMEQLRSGALERVAVALSRLYEGGQGFDLQRFLRDLPLALAHLAAADRSKSAPPPAEAGAASAGAEATAGAEAAAPAAPGTEAAVPAAPGTEAASPAAPGTEAAAPAAEAATPATAEASSATAAPAGSAAPAAAAAPAAEPSAPVNPRLELRSKLLTAAPQLAKAAASYRRNVATLKRAALARRSPGPWRADREVLEEARRAVDFCEKLYETYAEAWADQPLTPGLHEQTTAELDRFLAWTQLDRYVELAVMASTNAPRPPKPGQQVFGSSSGSSSKESAPPPPVTEGSPGAGGTVTKDAAAETAGASAPPPADSGGKHEPPAAGPEQSGA